MKDLFVYFIIYAIYNMVYFPNEIMDKIHGYLPILTEQKIIINESILSFYVMKKMIRAFAIYFNTEPEKEPSAAVMVCAIGWIYNDLILFFNNNIPINRSIQPPLIDFFSRFSKKKIVTKKDLLNYEDTFPTNKEIVMKCACYMTMDELESFWIYCDEVYNISSVVDDWDSL